jgi:ATP-dependent Lhr-like helicase
VAPAQLAKEWSQDDALVEVIRGRLESLGPVTRSDLLSPLGLDGSNSATPLEALEREGFAMRGRFTPGVQVEEWCDRRLLARIHHYTIKRLRAEIEPVPASDFLRFLLAWQRATPDTQMRGPKALDFAIGQLEGFQIAAGAWERDVLPARIGVQTATESRRLCGRHRSPC